MKFIQCTNKVNVKGTLELKKKKIYIWYLFKRYNDVSNNISIEICNLLNEQNAYLLRLFGQG